MAEQLPSMGDDIRHSPNSFDHLVSFEVSEIGDADLSQRSSEIRPRQREEAATRVQANALVDNHFSDLV